MHGPLPSTSELALLLPSWPTDSEWGKKNVPWFWSEDDFAQQTRALVQAGTSARELVAWLLHGVRWGNEQSNDGSSQFDDLVDRWSKLGGYLRVWTKAVGNTIPTEALEAHCKQLSWHPVWRNLDLSRVLDDFGWAHELRANIARRAAMRKPWSSLGALELAHCTNNFDNMYDSAQRICVGLWAGPEPSNSMKILKSTTLDLLHPAFVRGMLVVALLGEREPVLEASHATQIQALWHHQLNSVELDWWKVKMRSMMIREKTSAHFLLLGVHPFSLIHEDKRAKMELLRDLQPEAFRMGALLNGLLGNHDPTALPLPDLGMTP